ncbi:unnamed protein product, partial [Allacma fusca]
LKLKKYPIKFQDETRFTPAQFEGILKLIGPAIQNKSHRGSVSPKVRLLVTLKYLAEGCSRKELSRNFFLGHSRVCCIINETSRILWTKLSPVYMENDFGKLILAGGSYDMQFRQLNFSLEALMF